MLEVIEFIARATTVVILLGFLIYWGQQVVRRGWAVILDKPVELLFTTIFAFILIFIALSIPSEFRDGVARLGTLNPLNR